MLHEEILAVIAKHMTIDREKIRVKMDRGKDGSTLEIDIELPTPTSNERPQRASL